MQEDSTESCRRISWPVTWQDTLHLQSLISIVSFSLKQCCQTHLKFYLFASSSRGTFESVSFTAYNISPDVIKDSVSYFSFQSWHWCRFLGSWYQPNPRTSYQSNTSVKLINHMPHCVEHKLIILFLRKHQSWLIHSFANCLRQYFCLFEIPTAWNIHTLYPIVQLYASASDQ